MRKIIVFAVALACLILVSCAELAALLPDAGSAGSGLTTEEIISGLKEALSVGITNSASLASKMDGFNLNSAIKIPFPSEAVKVKNALEDAGLTGMVTDFERSLNRAAEEASKKALPIFKNAITGMTISDAVGVLRGADNAATVYLKSKTESALTAEFTPVVKNALQTVKVTKYWSPIASAYNTIAGLKGETQVNPDLNQYVTQKTLDGLFYLVGQEEQKIRKDPVARVSEILRKVFGSNS